MSKDSKPQRSEDSKHQQCQGCFESATAKLGILVACVILTVPSHNVCGTHNQPMTNGGRQTKSLRITGDRRVHNATITMRHTEHTVTVTQPGQSECTLILTQSHAILLTPNQEQEDADRLGTNLLCHKHLRKCRYLPGCTRVRIATTKGALANVASEHGPIPADPYHPYVQSTGIPTMSVPHTKEGQ